MSKVESLHNFAKTCGNILHTDRDCMIGVGGFTGEGKSTFLTKLFQAYSNVSGVRWNFTFMTWDRNELMKWINGDAQGKGQLPEYSAINVDELFLLFYKRTWWDFSQIESIATLNMCRDRHLLIGGNVPNFWDLDSAFLSRIRFYVYIFQRGIAWVFEQENNPFSKDAWNVNQNKIMFRHLQNPYSLPNFICQINFPDWTPKEKELYYQIRNEKRKKAIEKAQEKRQEKYGYIKQQRDEVIRLLFEKDKYVLEKPRLLSELKKLGWKRTRNKDLADVTGLNISEVRRILLRER